MKKILLSLKPYLKWVVLGGTLFFLAHGLKVHWKEVAAIRLEQAGWVNLAIAYLLTLIAFTWSALVWGSILRSFHQPVKYKKILQVYLKTNIAKYIPGNIWHYYGRISAVTANGGSLGIATVSTLLEIPLMVAAALIITLVGSQPDNWILPLLSLAIVLLAVHPSSLNPAMQLLSRLKGASTSVSESHTFVLIKNYPLVPLLGELGFLLLRGTGFLFAFLALTPVSHSQVMLLFSAFSFSWLLGLVVPGAPGGLGVFETTAIAILNRQFSPGIILSVVALFRLITILAEASLALVATLSESKWENYQK